MAVFLPVDLLLDMWVPVVVFQLVGWEPIKMGTHVEGFAEIQSQRPLEGVLYGGITLE